MPVCNCKVTFKRDEELIKNHIKEKNFNEEKIKDRIEKGEDIFQRGFKIKKINTVFRIFFKN